MTWWMACFLIVLMLICVLLGHISTHWSEEPDRLEQPEPGENPEGVPSLFEPVDEPVTEPVPVRTPPWKGRHAKGAHRWPRTKP